MKNNDFTNNNLSHPSLSRCFLYQLHPSIKILAFVLLLVFILKLPINVENIAPNQVFIFANPKRITLFYLFCVVALMILCFFFGVTWSYFWQRIKHLRFVFIISLVINLVPSEDTYFNAFMRAQIPILSYDAIHSFWLFLICILLYNFTKKYIPFKLSYLLFLLLCIFVIPSYFPSNIQEILGCKPKNYILQTTSFLRICFIMTRLFLIVMLFFLFNKITSFIEIQDGLDIILSPLKKLKIATETFTLMLSLIFMANSFLLQETNKILKAQTTRGMDLHKKNIFKRINHLLALLVPIFVLVFKRSLVLSNAMEVRGYVLGAPRTKMITYRWKMLDFITITTIFALLFIK
ncbi:MAG: energy-coupling factor transporter transmembrane protein EcfT [Candidatus Phytoplasma asteris]|nr:energy-coupling factor transporter transmembrane component T ['Chrysanthemum coronarium' phytoplasma]TKA87612.1 MAG: ABC-type cobalt transport system permease protein [Periwinkle leaf yellowing phytoplasma]WEX19971.1 MAG: energy-coupling factor transporter transmembrane protein EcfT [Candidatus Phytoplasma asteris]